MATSEDTPWPPARTTSWPLTTVLSNDSTEPPEHAPRTPTSTGPITAARHHPTITRPNRTLPDAMAGDSGTPGPTAQWPDETVGGVGLGPIGRGEGAHPGGSGSSGSRPCS